MLIATLQIYQGMAMQVKNYLVSKKKQLGTADHSVMFVNKNIVT